MEKALLATVNVGPGPLVGKLFARLVCGTGWWRRARGWGLLVLALTAGYLLIARAILPSMWRHYEHHPSLASLPKTTVCQTGAASDLLNVGLVATKQELLAALLAAGWMPAEPATFLAALPFAEAALAGRPYPASTASDLWLFGRKQDLTFEKHVPSQAANRHRVRLWMAEEQVPDKKPVWLGSATLERNVSPQQQQVKAAHHIAPDVDAERDALLADLSVVGQIVTLYQVTGVGVTLAARTSSGDHYYTDGELSIGVIPDGNQLQPAAPIRLENPSTVQWKDELWSWLQPLLGGFGPSEK